MLPWMLIFVCRFKNFHLPELCEGIKNVINNLKMFVSILFIPSVKDTARKLVHEEMENDPT